MSNIKKIKKIEKALMPDLKDKNIVDIVGLVQKTYEANDLNAELELQFIQLAINKDSRLVRAAKMNPESLYSSILQAAECGLSLNPQWQEGYFVPYNMKIDGKEVPTVTFSPMYRGKKKLLISKGVVKNIKTELVYKGELFDTDVVNGDIKITHKPDYLNREDPLNIMGGYATIVLNNDEIQHVVKGRDYFERCKAASQKKMSGTLSPAWKDWYDGMCRKCLVNAADSETPKIGVNSKNVQLLNDVNTNDVDYVDVSDEKDMESLPPKVQTLNDTEFSELINSLYDYSISLDFARQKCKGLEFTDEQIAQIKEAGTITEKRMDEVIKLCVDGDKTPQDFEQICSEKQLAEIYEALTDGQ